MLSSLIRDTQTPDGVIHCEMQIMGVGALLLIPQLSADMFGVLENHSSLSKKIQLDTPAV